MLLDTLHSFFKQSLKSNVYFTLATHVSLNKYHFKSSVDAHSQYLLYQTTQVCSLLQQGILRCIYPNHKCYLPLCVFHAD